MSRNIFKKYICSLAVKVFVLASLFSCLAFGAQASSPVSSTYNGMVAVYGELGKLYANQRVNVLLLEGDYTDFSDSKIAYIDSTRTDENGNYNFRFVCDEIINDAQDGTVDDYSLYVGVEGEDVTDSVITADVEGKKQCVAKIKVTPNLSGIDIVAEIFNLYGNTLDGTLFAAGYAADGSLISVSDFAVNSSDSDMTINNAFDTLSDPNLQYVKVFLWEDLDAAIPLSSTKKYSVAVNGEELVYSVSGNVMTVEYASVIPDYSSFEETMWSDEKGIRKIVFGESVTGIGANAFSGFTSLESVEFPEGIEVISDNAFPQTEFTVYGYANGAAEGYAQTNNKKFLLKKLRILTIGNSHTADHGQWNKEIFGDLKTAGMGTEIVYQRVVNGGFKMYSETSYDSEGYSKSHYAQANNSDSPYYSAYARQLDNYTWDLVLIQDYRESSRAYEDFEEGIAKTMRWLREKQPNAKIGWIVDWNDKNHGTTSRSELQDLYYNNTVSTVNKVKAMTADAPDIIIPMGTAMQNVRTSYLWDVNNAADCYMKYSNGDWAGSAEEIVKYNIIERDGTHCSYELGRYILGASVFGYIYDLYRDNLIGGDTVNFCDSLKTIPVTNGEDEWKGEFTNNIWAIVRETTENTIANPWTITNSVYTTDPAIAMADAVRGATYNDFTAAGIVKTIKELGGGFTVRESDVTVNGNTATVRFLYGYSEKTVTISK